MHKQMNYLHDYIHRLLFGKQLRDFLKPERKQMILQHADYQGDYVGKLLKWRLSQEFLPFRANVK